MSDTPYTVLRKDEAFDDEPWWRDGSYMSHGSAGATFRYGTHIVKLVPVDWQNFERGVLAGLDDPHIPENVEVDVGRQINELLDRRCTPHLVRLISSAWICDLKVTALALYTAQDDKRQELCTFLKDAIESMDACLDMCGRSIFRLITFEYVESVPLKLFIEQQRPPPEVVKQLIFQSVFTLAVLDRHMPTARHLDGHLTNFLVETLDSPRTFRYRWNEHAYQFRTRYSIRLIDFDWVYVNLSHENTKVGRSDRFGRTPETHPVFDVHYFLNMLKNELYLDAMVNDSDALSSDASAPALALTKPLRHHPILQNDAGMLQFFEQLFPNSPSCPYEGEYSLFCQDYKLSNWGLMQQLTFENLMHAPGLVDQDIDCVGGAAARYSDLDAVHRNYCKAYRAYQRTSNRAVYSRFRRVAWMLAKEIVSDHAVLYDVYTKLFTPVQRQRYNQHPLFDLSFLHSTRFVPRHFPTAAELVSDVNFTWLFQAVRYDADAPLNMASDSSADERDTYVGSKVPPSVWTDPITAVAPTIRHAQSPLDVQVNTWPPAPNDSPPDTSTQTLVDVW